MLSNVVIRRKRIQVSMARGYMKDDSREGYRQPTRYRQVRRKQIWQRKEQTNATKVVINQGSKIQAYKIVGD